MYLAFVSPVFFFCLLCCVSCHFCVVIMDAHKVELGPRVRPRLMVVLPQTLSVWGQVLFILMDHNGKQIEWSEGVSSVNGCFNPNCWLGSCFYLDGSQR